MTKFNSNLCDKLDYFRRKINLFIILEILSRITFSPPLSQRETVSMSADDAIHMLSFDNKNET